MQTNVDKGEWFGANVFNHKQEIIMHNSLLIIKINQITYKLDY